MSRSTLPLLLAFAVLLTMKPALAIGQDATPPAATGALLEVVVDRADLPGDEGFFIFGRNVAPPGVRHTYFNPDDKGVIAVVVESGVLTYELETEGRILRGANTANPVAETSPAGTPFTLEAGDALVYAAQKRVEANASDAPVSFLWLVALEPTPPPPPDPDDIGEVESIVLGRHDGPWMALPEGPIALKLQRTMVGPSAGLPVVPGGMQATAQESGVPGDLLIGGDGAAFNLGDEPVEALVMTIVPTIPAIAPVVTSPTAPAMASASREPAFEDVATVTLLAEAMPEEDAGFDAWMSVFEPDEELAFPSYGSQISIAADVVIGGDYGAQSEGRMQRQRDGTVEEITPGTEVALSSGDAVVYVENSAAQQVRNPGDTVTETVSFGVFPDSLTVTPAAWEQAGLARTDVAVHVRSLTLPPGASLPYTPRASEPTAYVVMSGDVDLAVIATKDASKPLATLRFLPGQVLPFRTLTEGNQFVLSNGGNEPLRLIELALTPAGG